ncbi:helix-turn-helix transcriptional regulator [Spectribacter hydrogenoxidans]|uniref:helix-turn-helix domain-containing protein n=1 Tax=Spectribacter hydrogenoxidans TaxID=3075608 RepID=UPI0032C22064
MIRFRLKELVAEREFQEGRVITLAEISKGTGIHRATLSKIANERGYNTGTENIDRLCSYFGCAVTDVMEHVPE